MLITVTFPIADLRGLFQRELDRIDNHKLDGWDDPAEWRYIRSVGMPKMRQLGPGFSNFNEAVHFSLDRILTQSSSPQNRRIIEFKHSKDISRFYQLDAIAARADIGFSITANPKKVGFDDIRYYLNNRKVTIEVAGSKISKNIVFSGPTIARTFQSRTTKESALRNKKAQESVFSATPIIFIEGTARELKQPTKSMQEVVIPIPGVWLFHGYSNAGQRVWMIRRDDSDSAFKQARLLRLFLSRIYTQQSVFRVLSRKVPFVINNNEDDHISVDTYTSYILRNRRFIKSLERIIDKTTGMDFGYAALFSMDNIMEKEIPNILEDHAKIISRRNVFRNLEKQINYEALQTKKAQFKSTNLIVNILGITKAKQSNNKSLMLAQAQVEQIDTTSALGRLAEFFTVYGNLLDKNKQDAVEVLLEEIADIYRTQSAPGPAVWSKMERIASIFDRVKLGQKELEEIVRVFSGRKDL